MANAERYALVGGVPMASLVLANVVLHRGEGDSRLRWRAVDRAIHTFIQCSGPPPAETRRRLGWLSAERAAQVHRCRPADRDASSDRVQTSAFV